PDADACFSVRLGRLPIWLSSGNRFLRRHSFVSRAGWDNPLDLPPGFSISPAAASLDYGPPGLDTHRSFSRRRVGTDQARDVSAGMEFPLHSYRARLGRLGYFVCGLGRATRLAYAWNRQSSSAVRFMHTCARRTFGGSLVFAQCS